MKAVSPLRVRPRALWLCLLYGGIAILSGCGQQISTLERGGTADAFIPSAADAEAALRAVLEAWEKGVPPGIVPGTSPAVHVTDTFRKPGEKLIGYRILGEMPSARKRCIAAELRFEPERAERVRFLVVGINPLWVFRQEDADNLAHWEHNAGAPIPARKAEANTPKEGVGRPASLNESAPATAPTANVDRPETPR